jgi:hypothetical protein
LWDRHTFYVGFGEDVKCVEGVEGRFVLVMVMMTMMMMIVIYVQRGVSETVYLL